ncbi:leucine-rich repeat domain-containing protein [Winogradskyella thalassocola]|uniref:Leucine rich repeat-containing protein n=1 Tax=Winogradskyella thalassocola TaxID=262004 RepID=A0A1G8FIC9_9FLAO|nr:leucine-rich repeat domain-containing protein [Winogradskyella thalassocola]SDH81858.1 Leucine rich repeat-containing protein [Winogradskyella thalassocola]
MSVKDLPLLVLFILLTSPSIFAQNAKSESIKSVFFSIPAYDITTSPSLLKYSFAMGNTSFDTPKSIEAEEVCVAAGSKNALKDAKKITVYQYSVSAEINDAYLIIENPSGNILYAEEFNSYQRTGSLANETIEFIYGEDKCYWHPQVLEESWNKDKVAWKNEQHQSIKARFIEKAQRSAKFKMQGGYVDYSVNVFTGKGGKGYDYSDLDEAQRQAITVYDNMYKDGKVNAQTIDQLMIPVNRWLTFIKEVNLDDKKAKINRKVAQGLYMNLATAYFQARNFDEASKYLELYEDAYNNPVLRGTDQGVIQLSKLIVEQRKGIAANTNQTYDYDALNKLVMPTNIEIEIDDLGESMVNELSGSYSFYAKDKEKEASVAASGSIYKSNISPGQYGPTLVMMTVYDGDLNEFPLEVTQLDIKGLVFTGGYSFEHIPAEIGNMTNLQQINLTASNVSSIPEEIGQLINLKRLNLSKTKISKLPESIKNLKNLKMLNIKNTNISDAEVAKIKSWLPKGCKLKV